MMGDSPVRLRGYAWGPDNRAVPITQDYQLKSGWNVLKMENKTVSNFTGIELQVQTLAETDPLYIQWLKVEQNATCTDWVPNDADSVHKGNMMATMNIEAGSELFKVGDNILNITPETTYIADATIKTAMIANAAITSAQIANATIKSANIESLNGNKIVANSITADKLAVNAIQVGINSIGNVIKIDPYSLSFYDGGTKIAQLDQGGNTFWYGNREIGHLGQSQKTGDANVRGIAMNLNGQGDFVTWGYRAGTSGDFTSMLTLDPQGKFGGEKGISADIDLHVAGDKGLFAGHFRSSGYTATAELKLAPTTIDSKDGAYFGSESGVGGISYHNDSVFLHTGAGIFDLYFAARLGAMLHGNPVKLPTSFNGQGVERYLDVSI